MEMRFNEDHWAQGFILAIHTFWANIHVEFTSMTYIIMVPGK